MAADQVIPPRMLGPSRRQIRARRAGALVALVVLAGVAAAVAVVASLGSSGTTAPPRTFTVVFPEGFARAQMVARVGTVAASAARMSGKPVALTEQGYVAATAHARVPCFGQAVRRKLEGFLFPATYDFLATTTATQLVAAQLQAFCREWNTVDLSYARSKKLTPYDVLEIASMIEREVQVPEERPPRRRRRLQPPARGHVARPRLDAPLRPRHPGDAGDPRRAAHRPDVVQHAAPYGGRRPRFANPGLAAIRAAAHPARVDYLYFVLRPGTRRSFFTASADVFYAYECAHGYGC